MARASDSTLTPSACPLTGNFRDRLAEANERLIAVLDALDGAAMDGAKRGVANSAGIKEDRS